MNEKLLLNNQTGGLRSRAEKLLAAKGGELKKISKMDVLSLVQELQVHQIELEMQNEELRQAQENVAEARDRYADLYDFAPVGYFSLDRKGTIREVNLTGAGLLGLERSRLVNQPFCRWVAPEFQEACRAHFLKVYETGVNQTCEVKIRSQDGQSFFVSLESRAAPGERGPERSCRTTMSDITDRKIAEAGVKRGVERLHQALQGTVAALADIVETKDPYTAGHHRRVAQLAGAMARELGWPPDKVKGMEMLSCLHDLGKIAVPTEILSRPGMISPAEFDLIKIHPQVGYDILKDIDFLWPVAQGVLQHHERLDGTGYPGGLKGEEILPEARILAVADVVEAMASHRPYRAALGIEMALQEINDHKGSLYDPEIVGTCVKLFAEEGFAFEQSSLAVSARPGGD